LQPLYIRWWENPKGLPISPTMESTVFWNRPVCCFHIETFKWKQVCLVINIYMSKSSLYFWTTVTAIILLDDKNLLIVTECHSVLNLISRIEYTVYGGGAVTDLGSITFKCNRLHYNYFAIFMITLHYDYINFQM
jgi:hypothetical protein